ncbi:hypothetical protein DB346_09680 [Verrucomicrobia bacterium LW23]|nr:hypothetical protein DB346_09680 [Verrucomicrobia bacterium LW23]
MPESSVPAKFGSGAPASRRSPHNSVLALILLVILHLLPKRAASLAALCAFLLSIPLHADQKLPLEDAHKLRQDVTAAKEALGRIRSNPDATAADEALGRIATRLDAYIDALAKAAASADIYDNGNKYPAIAKVAIEDFDVPVDCTVVHVPVKLDKPSANTVIAYVRVYDGQGGKATPDVTKPVIFRSGDPLVKTVSFNVAGMKEGNNVKAVQISVPDGGERGRSNILITAKADAVNEPIAGGREPLKFEAQGKLCYSVTGETIKFDDKGSADTFSSALVHGRTQPNNGETGYYSTVDMGCFSRTPEGLVLSSKRLSEPKQVGSPPTLYPFAAAMLSGHNTTDAQFKYGTVEWVAKMPNRKGSWPALWLLPTSGWPPEIDVYEGFGYNGSWKFPASLSTNLHGGQKGNHKFSRPAMHMKMSTFGLPDTLDSEFHTFAVTVEPEWITMYINGVETMRYANPFKGQTWYPLTNVAVKAKADSAYDDGSGDMTLRSLKVWRIE